MITDVTLNKLVYPLDAVAGGGELFGISCSTFGIWAVVGCPYKYIGGTQYGAVYVYKRNIVSNTWDFHQKLEASDKIGNDDFGISVAIHRETIIIGASQNPFTGGGKAYIFILENDTWTESRIITGSTIAAGDYFGTDVDIFDNTAIIGAPSDDDSGISSGTAWIFVKSGSDWIQQQKLEPSDAAAGKSFGNGVAIHGDSVVIGSAAATNPAAYVFTTDGTTWTQQQKLTGDQSGNVKFGYAVDIFEDTVTIGAYDEDDTYADSGAVYIFTRSNNVWTRLQRIPMPSAYSHEANEQFGYSVALGRNYLVIGANRDDDPGDPALVLGSMYVYEFNGSTWDFFIRVFPKIQQNFGESVAINEYYDTIMVGAYLETVGALLGEGTCRFYDIVDDLEPDTIRHRFEIPDIQIVKTLTTVNQWNQFDDHGGMVSLSRLRGEKNWEYKRRIYDVFANMANSTYRGLVNGVTRELGLELSRPMRINPKVDSNGDFLAADPYIKFDGVWLCLYSDYTNDLLDYQIDRYEPGGNYEHLGRLVDLINTTSYFEASLEGGVDYYSRSMTILNQSNKETVFFERIPISSRFQLENTRIIRGSVYFSNRDTFRTEVASLSAVDSIGKYYINYSKGIVTVYTVPTSEDIVRYQYIKYPFRAVASPIILHDINDDNFKVKMFEQVLLDDGTYTHGVPTELGLDIINELFSVVPMYWGV